MNSVSANTEELKQADFLESFAEDLQEEQRLADEQYMHCFDEENGEVIFNNVTEDDILHNEYLYKYVMILSDETEINSYITELRQVAKGCKLTADFDRKMNTYRRQAVKDLKTAQRDKKRQKLSQNVRDLTEFPYIQPHLYEDGSVKYTVCCPLLSEYIRQNCHFITVHERNSDIDRIFWYDGGVYKPVNDYMLQGYIKGFITRFDKEILQMKDVREVMLDLKTDLNFVDESLLNADENIINFQNGLLDLCSMKLCEHSPDVLSTIQIPCNYNPENTLCTVFAEYLYTLTSGDMEKYEFLLEFMAVAISNIKGYRMKKALFMFGRGDTGKSKLKELTEKLLGSENCSAGDLATLEERFGTSALYMKRLYGSGDMSFVSVSELKIFKCITGGDDFFCEFKGKTPFRYRYNGLVWFCTNKLPSFGGDKGEWVYNRICAVDCNNVIPPEKQDKQIVEKMYAEREGIINMLIPALQNVIKNGYKFTIPKACKDNNIEYMEQNSPIRMFYKECCILRENLQVHDNYTQGKIFNAFKLWYSDNYGSACRVSTQTFKRELAEILGFPTANGIEIRKSYGRFYPITLNSEAIEMYGMRIA